MLPKVTHLVISLVPTSFSFRPASMHFCVVFFSFSTFRPVIATFTPCLANSTAVAAPRPELPPNGIKKNFHFGVVLGFSQFLWWKQNLFQKPLIPLFSVLVTSSLGLKARVECLIHDEAEVD